MMNETTRSFLQIHVGKLKDQLAHEQKMESVQAGQLNRTRLTMKSLTTQIADLTETLNTL